MRRLAAELTPVAEQPRRGLDHGAYVPLLFMYPAADVPVLQVSMPSQDPRVLLEIGRRLAPLRDQGVLVVGSGHMTHGLPFLTREMFLENRVPGWSADFDAWAADALARNDLDTLVDFRHTAPGLRDAHPTLDHFLPLFVALGASLESGSDSTTAIDGYWLNNSKRSIELR